MFLYLHLNVDQTQIPTFTWHVNKAGAVMKKAFLGNIVRVDLVDASLDPRLQSGCLN